MKSPVGVEVGATRVEVKAGVVLAVPTQHMRKPMLHVVCIPASLLPSK